MPLTGISIGSQAADRLGRYQHRLSHIDVGKSLVGVFDGTETFEATLCRGEGRPADATFTAAWDSSITGNPATLEHPVILLTITPEDLAGLTEWGLYYVKVWLAEQAVDILPPASTVEILPPAGSEPKPRTYCTLDDVRDVCPWVEDVLRRHPTAQIDLAEQRGMAAGWVEDTFLARAATTFSEWRTYGILPVWTRFSDRYTRLIRPNATILCPDCEPPEADLRAAIEAGGLSASVGDPRFRQALAYQSAFYVTDPLRWHESEGDRYAKSADAYRARARLLLTGCRLRLHVAALDDPDVPEDLSIVDLEL
jgi:hypothetical protein